MAPNRGVEITESQADILQKLSSTGEYLRSSTSSLLIEMKVLNKLIYKSKNTHSKEKFFKCFERIKKCLNKWKLLNLDKKVISAIKSVYEAEKFREILNEIMLGGQLAIRIIIFCQEAVQYSLAYLSRGFFVTLHVTLISLASRIWVLQKDCWVDLVECYQLVRSLLQTTEKHNNFNTFPKCLTSWLSDDVKKIFDARNVCVNDSFSAGSSTNSLFQHFFQEKNDSDTPIMLTDLHNHDEVDLDLGEPVEDMRKLYPEDNVSYAITKSTNENTVSDLTTNLTSQFAWERVKCKRVRKNDHSVMIKQNTRFDNAIKKRTSKELYNRKTRSKLDELRTSDQNLVQKRQRRILQGTENSTFIKKISCRFTLRSLLATKEYTELSMKRIIVLLKLLRFVLRSKMLLCERKIVLRIQRLLKRELKKRGHRQNRRKIDESFCTRITDKNEDFGVPGYSGNSFTEVEKSRMCYRRKRNECLFRKSHKNWGRSDSCQKADLDGLKNSLFSHKNQKDRKTENENFKQDEIDSIFNSLGL